MSDVHILKIYLTVYINVNIKVKDINFIKYEDVAFKKLFDGVDWTTIANKART